MTRMLAISLLLFLCKNTFAQNELSNLRVKKILPKTGWQTLDTLTVAPATVKVFNFRNKESTTPRFKISNNRIYFSDVFQKDSLTISYRVLPFNIGVPAFRIDGSQIEQNSNYGIISHNPFIKENSLPDFGKMNYTGTFSRGISFGNSQNLVLNSALNLQMAGQLANDVEILAAVTDNSIPLQPEGNTAQLQEFDRIFVQLKRKNSTLIAGDYELKRPNRYFINYLKKLQGATFFNKSDFSKKKVLKTKASVAVARGKFARNILAAQEGNQGPYRLRGNENERFIIALAGTEKVYLNGKVLQRGQDDDYVIDYNAASITFTHRQLINKDSRIVVEFEYTDQSYLRSLSTVDLDYESSKADFFFTFYTDQDSKTSVADRALSDSEKLLLTNAGDGIGGRGEVFSSGIFPEEDFNVLRVNYTLTDTVICGRRDSILRYATSENGRVFTARFTQVGQGNGNYILDNEQAANGRAYRYVPPVNCQSQGDYEPILLITAPKQQQLFSAGSKIKFSKKGFVKLEGSLSNFDLNRFSKIDDEDNRGIAGMAEIRQIFELNKISKNLQLETTGAYEIRNENFNSLNRYRPQEFDRDWNLAQTTNGQLGESNLEKSAEHWTRMKLTLKHKKAGSFEYGFDNYLRQKNYAGQRQFSKLSLKRNGYETRVEGSLLNAETNSERSRFFRPKVYFEKHFFRKKTKKDTAAQLIKNWSLGLAAEREDNRRQDMLTDTLNTTSFLYDFIKAFAQYQHDKNLNISFAGSRRLNYLPSGNEFEQATIADDLEWSGDWQQNKSGNLNWSLNYRKLTVKNTRLTSERSGETYLGRIGYNFSIWKGAVRSTTNYQIGSGQEPKIEFNYLRVNDGEGIYQWNDYNADEIPQLNEFEIAVFKDSGSFVRVSVLTDEFIRSNNAVFNQNLQITPRSAWKKANGLKKFISRFSEQSTWQIARRVRDLPGISQWNPFGLSVTDSALVSVNSSIRNTLFFNRNAPVFDLRFGLNNLLNRVVITSGFESRKLSELSFGSRWNFSRQWIFKTNFRQIKQTNNSENFGNRNYEIDILEGEPSLSWQPNTFARTSLKFRKKVAENLIAGNEKLNSNNLILEMVYNFSGKKNRNPASVRFNFTAANVNFSGTANSPSGFVMLEGLRNGRNYLWNLNFEKQLFNNLRLNLNYEGRKTGSSKIVHLGRAQVAAVF